jgi:chaperone BCS1
MRISKDVLSIASGESKGSGSQTKLERSENFVKRSPLWDISDFTSSKTFSNVFFSDKARILQQIEHFLTGEEFYRQRGIPWTLNILLYGVPGCGKTSFIKALSNMVKRHIVDVSLSAIKTTEDFRYVFNTELFKDTYIPIDKRIIVLEDIDCMGSDILTDRGKRTAGTSAPSEAGEDQMNLSCFLNTLDGIHEQNGRIIIATTNCIDTLDPAVLRRFNVKVNFTHLTRSLAQSIINNYYNTEVPLSDGWMPCNLTGATLTQLCMQFQEDPELLIRCLTTNYGEELIRVS